MGACASAPPNVDIGADVREPSGSSARHWWAVVLVSGLVAAFTTSGQMAEAPTPTGAAVLLVALLTAVVVVARFDRLGRVATPLLFCALAALGAAAAMEAWKPGYPLAHDVHYHSWAIWSVWRSVLDGDFWPRWNPYLGLGMPFLQFYAPLSYVLAWPAQALGAPPDRALASVLVFGQMATAFSAWGSARWLGASRPGALLAAAGLCLLPYHLLDQNVRLALGELVAFPVFPVFFAALWKVVRGDGVKARWVLSAAAAALLLSHVLSVLTVAIASLPLVAIALPSGPSRRRAVLALVGAGALAVALTAFWWLPVITESPYTSLSEEAPLGRFVGGSAPGVPEWFERRSWTGYAARQSRWAAGERTTESMPLYVGNLWLAMLVLALFRPPRPALATDPEGTDPRPLAVASAAALLLGSWPCALLLDVLQIGGRIQFPWRLLGPSGALLVLATALSLDRWWPARRRTLVAAVVMGMMVWDAWPLLGSPGRRRVLEGTQLSWVRRGKLQGLDVGTGDLVRVMGLSLPPSSYAPRVGMVRPTFPEYLRPTHYATFRALADRPDDRLAERLGARWRFQGKGRRPARLKPAPLATLGGAPVDLAILPEELAVVLPADHGGGGLHLLISWFPGWEQSIDGGPFEAVIPKDDFLHVEVGPDARTVDFRYCRWHPPGRAVGVGVSLVTALGLGVGAIVRRWRRRVEANRIDAAGPSERPAP